MQSHKIAALPTRYDDFLPAKSAKDPEVNCLLISTWWNEGGYSFLSGTAETKGVAVSFSPAVREGPVHRYAAASGLRYIAAEAHRMSRKLIKSVRDRAIYEIERKVGKGWEVLQAVLKKEQLTLKT